MANPTHNDGKVLGRDSEEWGTLCNAAFLVMFGAAILGMMLGNGGHLAFGALLMVSGFLLFLVAVGGWILALVRGRQAKKEREGQQEIQNFLSSPQPPSRLTADPALYRRAQAELQTRKEEALKMQELHALRQQVEEEERKAGIFAPTLSPTQPQAGSKYSPQTDPMAVEMARLAQRRIEADRQKHLMKSLRTVEDAEWEADDV